MKIILASQSPRRREILTSLGYEFDIVIPNVNEDLIDGLSPVEFVKLLSRRKADVVEDLVGANSVRPQHKTHAIPDTFFTKEDNNETIAIIAADTVVAINGQILGKPIDEADAFNMLNTLSGNQHSVFTGFTVIFLKNKIANAITDVCETRVKFKILTDSEILDYIKTGEPMDKAGSYGIQGLAKDFIETFDGSLTNVIGLPADELQAILQKAGLQPPNQ